MKVAVAGLVAVLALAACGPAGSKAATNADDREPLVTVAQVPPSPRAHVPSALDNPRDPAFPAPLIDPGALRSGGPPPDGIPPVDHPRFAQAGTVRWLSDREPVLAFDLGSEARAYPVQILVWHEIVNDTVGGVPVALTYCPLCNSAIAFDRRSAGRVLDFGTSGQLYNSDLVMYDRQTQSLWPQLLGKAAVGALAGTALRAYPVATVSWGEWRRAHPDGLVLSRKTGFDRDYGRNPYPGYDDVGTSPFLFDGKVDGRLPAKARVVGLRDGADAVAVSFDLLRRRWVVVDAVVGGRAVVVWLAPGAASVLDADRVADGRDAGTSGVFDRRLDGRQFEFVRDGDGFRDSETATHWDVLGRATAGPLAGRQLGAVIHVDTFWFAWAAFEPATRLVA